MGEEEVKENKYGKVTINSTREQTLTGVQPEGTIGASVGAVATSTSLIIVTSSLHQPAGEEATRLLTFVP